MHTDVTMMAKAWKGRRSDHSCSESDNFVSVSSVCLSVFLAICLPKVVPALTWRISKTGYCLLDLFYSEKKKNQEVYDLPI